ncbi:hypothetical protein AcV5_010177 [Taiwanofungus camphoratus]|nr:hypothetical protein AcV5_010177 [Antrodia cinnamomea]
MPGPRNAKKKKQAKAGKARRSQGGRQSLDNPVRSSKSLVTPSPPTTPPPAQPVTPMQVCILHDTYDSSLDDSDDDLDSVPLALTKTPFIHDPGNGPRVRDTRAFLSSSFAAPPSLDDPLCAEFAQEEVLQMLCSVLPEETAHILWYNKSRRLARVCPACQRLYRLGDVLQDHLQENKENLDPLPDPVSSFLYREQELSGLCSPVCFILAAYNYPGAICSTWGRLAEELNDETWDLLDGPGRRQDDVGLGMLLKMTRCHDLGLAQLFFPDLDVHADTVDDGVQSVHSDDGPNPVHLDKDLQRLEGLTLGE